jgi:cytochrome c oxidase cbb3-type subunit I/II
MLGVPYGSELGRAESIAREQAHQISKDIMEQGGPDGLEDKQIVALVAYLQRLGTDLSKLPVEAPPTAPVLAGTGEGVGPRPQPVLAATTPGVAVSEVAHAAQ